MGVLVCVDLNVVIGDIAIDNKLVVFVFSSHALTFGPFIQHHLHNSPPVLSRRDFKNIATLSSNVFIKTLKQLGADNC